MSDQFYSGRKLAAALASRARPAPFGTLQRKCACGHQGSSGGMCTQCARKQEGLQSGVGGGGIAPRADSRLGHEFGHVHVHSTGPGTGIRSSLQFSRGEQSRKYSPEGVLMTLAGSGNCQNGGGESVCRPATGVYEIIRNSNTCCTKDCTQSHEQTHVNDVTGWGCCKALSDAYKKPGADKNALVTKYNEWMAKVVDITECHAYTHDVKCADDLAGTKQCDAQGKGSDCCKDIADYKARYGAEANTRCGRAPKNVEPCPAF